MTFDLYMMTLIAILATVFTVFVVALAYSAIREILR